MPVRVLRTAMNLLGIQIGDDKLQLVTGTLEGKILDRQQMRVDHASGDESVRAKLATLLKKHQKRLDWYGVGVGYGGPVDWQTGRICCPYALAEWKDFPLGDWLREQTRLPVVVDNDTNAAAYAEANCGAGAGADPVFYSHSGSEVGGCVVDGRIYHGAMQGETGPTHPLLGHDSNPAGDRCTDHILDRVVAEAARTQPGSALAGYVASDPERAAPALGSALMDGCPVAQAIVTQAGDRFASGLSHAVKFFAPQIIVLGGSVSLLGEPWRVAVAERLPKYVANARQPGPEVRLASLGELAVPRGAMLLAAEACGARQAKHSHVK